jgi:hypothetical protein
VDAKPRSHLKGIQMIVRDKVESLDNYQPEKGPTMTVLLQTNEAVLVAFYHSFGVN